MSILKTMSKEEAAIYKAAKLKQIRDYHADFISDLQLSTGDFNMKSVYRDHQGRLVVALFDSEFKRPKGFFFEIIDSDLNPVDPERTIYRVPPSNSYEEEYELSNKGLYQIPLDEIRVVNKQSVAISKSSAITPDEDIFMPTVKHQQKEEKVVVVEDAPYSDMTIRDYYAIHTGKPVSGKTWLNELIKNNK